MANRISPTSQPLGAGKLVWQSYTLANCATWQIRSTSTTTYQGHMVEEGRQFPQKKVLQGKVYEKFSLIIIGRATLMLYLVREFEKRFEKKKKKCV